MRDFVAIFRAMNGIAFAHPSPSGLQKNWSSTAQEVGEELGIGTKHVSFLALNYLFAVLFCFCCSSKRPDKSKVVVWSNLFESLGVELQVLRKLSYKGSQSTGLSTLPLDCATSLGVLQVVASVLPCNALQAQTIEQCQKILEFMDYFAKINLTLHPLGRRVECELEVINNQVAVKQLQSVLKRMGVQWSRPGWN